MSYQSLYRRYRPQKFAEVRGQDHLVRALRNAVIEGRVGHAYLFSGPRGTGKTSTARILAKVLNCENVVDGEPCGECVSCQAIEHGSSFDVFELDAASNNGVEAIRTLIERAQLGSPGRTKVYILDEVHMLTAGASNALLKTLEEPPDHVVFVLATTDPQKVLPTIKSRTQHFDVHLLSADELRELAEYIVGDAGLDVTPEAIDYVVRVGAGSARDTLSALDQVVAAGGIPDDGDALDELVEALCDRDTGRALIAVDAAMNTGRTPRILGENLIARLRDVFLAAMKSDLSRLPERDRARVAEWAQRLGAAGSTRALEVLGDAFVGIADAPDPRIPLEVALVRLTKPEADHSLEVIVERLERLERGLGPLGTVPPPAPHTTTHPHVDAVEPEPEPEADADEVAPAAEAPAGSGPAHLAREELKKSLGAKGKGSSATTKKAAPPRPPSTPAGPTAAPRRAVPRDDDPFATDASPAAPPVEPAPAPAAASTAAPAPAPTSPTPTRAAAAWPAGQAPTRDDLTLAWGDSILTALSQKAKSRFAGGRFISVTDGVATFGLPNIHHANRCAEVKPEVEEALTEYFGVPVSLLITVDDDAQPPPSPGGGASSRAVPEVDEVGDVDLETLVDADATATSSVDRIATVFPGVEVVDEA